MKRPPGARHVLITGASSGLGEALALAYAETGVRLALSGRDAVRLERVAFACRERGARVASAAVDATDADAMRSWIETQDEALPLDLAIANAGISGGTSGAGDSVEQVRRIFATNVAGVVNTIEPAAKRMVARGRGHLALMSSLASFRGFPGSAAYCASKAAVRLYGEGLAAELRSRGVAVSVICPGYVRTRMTAVNRFYMPFLMDAERAAEIMKRGLERRRARIAFPWRLYALVRLLAALPPGLVDRLVERLPRKSPL